MSKDINIIDLDLITGANSRINKRNIRHKEELIHWLEGGKLDFRKRKLDGSFTDWVCGVQPRIFQNTYVSMPSRIEYRIHDDRKLYVALADMPTECFVIDRKTYEEAPEDYTILAPFPAEKKKPRRYLSIALKWLNGYSIQCGSGISKLHCWRDIELPSFADEIEYRIKPPTSVSAFIGFDSRSKKDVLVVHNGNIVANDPKLERFERIHTVLNCFTINKESEE